MKTIAACAVALLLPCSTLYAADKKPGIQISFNFEDSRGHIASRHAPADARLAITSRDGSTTLMLLKDVVAVQLSDRTMANVQSKEETGFLGGLVLSTVKFALGKAVEYPVANIRTADVRNGELRLISDEDEPVFSGLKVNGTNVLRDFAPADAARFVNAFRLAKAGR
jgi:hypothetical protein